MKRFLATAFLLFGISAAFAQNDGYQIQNGVVTGMTGIFNSTTLGSTPFTASGTSTGRSPSARAADVINVKDEGAKGDALGFTSGSMTSGSAVLSDTTAAPFLPTDCTGGSGCTGTVNKNITVDGAGSGGAPLSSTIVAYSSASSVTLANNASTTVPYSYAADNFFVVPPPAVATSQSGSGSYSPGDTVTLTGGTASTQAVLTVTTTKLVSATVNAAGSGGTTGACILTGTTGASSAGPGKFTINATIASGAISSLGSIISGGQYTTKTTNVTAEPVTSNCGLTGATLVLKMGVNTVHVSTLGNYSTFPSNPVSQGSTSGSGTGATFTLFSSQTGSYTYGTDDSAAVTAAINEAMSLLTSQRPTLYFPGGTYYMEGTTTTTITKPIAVRGDSPHTTGFFIDPAYVGDLFSTSDVWGKANYLNGMSPTVDSAGVNFSNFSVWGNVHASNVQNALSLYDRTDYAIISNVQVNWLHGMALFIGEEKNQNQSYMRESVIYGIKAQFCGTSTLPCIHITTENTSGGFGDSTNEDKFYDINVFSAQSSGIIIDNQNNTTSDTRLLKFFGLRVEQSSNGDNIDIGLSSNTGRTESIDIFGLEEFSPPGGFWNLNFADNASGFHNFSMYADGIEFGGFIPGGGGINIQDGQQMQFVFNGASVAGYALQTASSTTVPFSIAVNFGSSEASLAYNLGTAGVVKVPTWANAP
jgi:hypothetical protein